MPMPVLQPPTLRRSARIVGWLTFALFELTVSVLVWLVASIRCCAASAGAAPQSASEWVALALFAATMLLLGAAMGLGTAFAAEGLLRVAGRFTKPGEADS